MVPTMKDILRRVKYMGMEHTSGQINPNILVIGFSIILKDEVYINGQMVDNMMAIGLIISFTEKEFTPGKMAESMKDLI